MAFKFLEHTADIKVEVISDSLEKAFEEAYIALKQVIVDDVEVRPIIKKKIQIKGRDNEALLYNFLEEFIFLLDAEDFLLSKIKSIKIKSTKLEAEVVGDKASNYDISNNVKAITYNDMVIEKIGNKYKLVFVLDV